MNGQMGIMIKISPQKLLGVVSVLALMVGVNSARAGFEWRGPVTPPVPAQEASRAEDMQDLAPITGDLPVIEWNENDMPVEKVAPVEVAPVPVVETVPVETAPVQTVPPAPVAEILPVLKDEGDVISGFGSEMPLVIALQQIVPPGHRFSFAAGVNPGMPVTWEGGKGWKKVLEEALAPRGLAYVLEDNIVVVGLRGEMPAPETEPAPTPMAEKKLTPDEEIVWTEPVQEDTVKPVDIRRRKPAHLMHRQTTSEEPAVSAVAQDAPVISKSEQIPTDMVAPVQAVQDEHKEYIAAPPVPRSAPVTATEKPEDLLARLRAKMGTSSVAPAPAVSAPPVVTAAPIERVPEIVTEAPVNLTTPPAEDLETARMAKPAPAPALTATILSEKPQVQEPAPQMVEPSWHAATGQTLREVLKNWSDVAGVELYWSIDYDYRLSADVAFGGNYDEAVGKLLDKFSSARPQPYGQLHQDGASARVLVIKSYDLR
jgi:hypothetical protein